MAQTGGNDNTPPAKIWPRGKKTGRIFRKQGLPHILLSLPTLSAPSRTLQCKTTNLLIHAYP